MISYLSDEYKGIMNFEPQRVYQLILSDDVMAACDPLKVIVGVQVPVGQPRKLLSVFELM